MAMAAASTAIRPLPATMLCCCSSSRLTAKQQQQQPKEKKRKWKGERAIGNFEHLFGVVKKDVEFLKNGISRGLSWTNDALQVPKMVKTVDDLIWLRNLEDPNSPPFQSPSWPQPSYAGLEVRYSADGSVFLTQQVRQ
ncbi:hypothetical protein Dimus_021193 [Dionaea muscipula]